MKKIISFAAALVMMVSAALPVFAALQQPEGANPTTAITLTKDAGPDGDGYYDYTMTIDLKELGTLNDEGSRKKSGLKLHTLSIDLRADKAMDVGLTEVSGNLGDAGTFANTVAYTGDDASGVNICYYTSAADKAYPSVNGTVTECDDAVVLKFYSMEGEITLSNASVGFIPFVDGAIKKDENQEGYETAIMTLNMPETTFTIGDTVEPAELKLDVTNPVDAENGYIWDASITKGEADVNSFTAEFKAGAESTTREVKNVGEILNKFEGGKVSFNIGLLTERTLDEAKFTVGDAAGASSVATVPMNQ